MADQHPLVLELNSLRSALNQYQHAAHVSSIQLQRAKLEASEASEQVKILEAENDRLKHEIVFLRANVEPSQTSRQITELSLALRRASDRITLLEEGLLKKTTELTHTSSEKHKLQLELKQKLALLDQLRKVQHDGKSRETELERRCKGAQEEARMADTVVMEYASLVRSLELKLSTHERTHDEARDDNFSEPPTLGEHAQPLQSLAENRASLQRLLHEFNAESAKLQVEITQLHGELADIQTALAIEQAASGLDRQKLGEILTELELHKIDDTTASRIVSRYMRFSQSSIDNLQTALSIVKSRHSASLATLTASSDALVARLVLEQGRASRLRDALDQLTEDVSRESFGRRREVALKLRCLTREEKVHEKLRGWLLQAEERHKQLESNSFAVSPETIVNKLIEDARSIITSFNMKDDPPLMTPWARVLLAEQTCSSLVLELQKETEKRLELTKFIAISSSSSSIKTEANWDQVPKYDSSAAHSKNVCGGGDVLDSNSHDSSVDEQTIQKDEEVSQNVESIFDEISFPIGSSPSMDQLLEKVEESHSMATLLNNEGGFDEITAINSRYDRLQRSFRDCHIALSQLKTRTAQNTSHRESTSLIQAVILRLDDFCEDARVELEIRIADEERMVHEFKTMLGLGTTKSEKAQEEFKCLINGTSQSVLKAQQFFDAKLEDLEHDIAQIKRVLDEDLELGEPDPNSFAGENPTWTWTKPFLPSYSRGQSPAPTFGAVITSHYPRPPNSRTSSSSSATEPRDPYLRFGLRIPMPHSISNQTNHSSVWLPSPVKPKTGRSSSGYLLGLGVPESKPHLTTDLSNAARYNESSEGLNYIDIE